MLYGIRYGTGDKWGRSPFTQVFNTKEDMERAWDRHAGVIKGCFPREEWRVTTYKGKRVLTSSQDHHQRADLTMRPFTQEEWADNPYLMLKMVIALGTHFCDAIRANPVYKDRI